MAEKHDRLVAHYRARLVRSGYKIRGRSPFVDYRPDIYATKGTATLFVEAEIEATIHPHHTLEQLEIMYTYVSRDAKRRGVLLVPITVARGAFSNRFGVRGPMHSRGYLVVFWASSPPCIRQPWQVATNEQVSPP
jgi:hypothetical protein